jgi:CRP/FNR family transcriptional regulator, dissimilatory nitrate respiration regulator
MKQEIDLVTPCSSNCEYCFLNYTDNLMQNPLFRGLDKDTTARMIKSTHHQVKRLQKGEIFAHEGDPVINLIIIVGGIVVGEMMDLHGNMLLVEKRTVPQSIATAFLFGERTSYPVTITATEETKLLLIARQDLLNLFTQSSEIMKNYMDTIADRAQFLSGRIKLLSLPGLRAKLAAYMLELMNQNGKTEIQLPHTQQELADMFASTRPSVGRLIRELHDEGIIGARGKKVTVVEVQKLKAFIK